MSRKRKKVELPPIMLDMDVLNEMINITNAEFENQMKSALDKSGYLELWAQEREQNKCREQRLTELMNAEKTSTLITL